MIEIRIFRASSSLFIFLDNVQRIAQVKLPTTLLSTCLLEVRVCLVHTAILRNMKATIFPTWARGGRDLKAICVA